MHSVWRDVDDGPAQRAQCLIAVEIDGKRFQRPGARASKVQHRHEENGVHEKLVFESKLRDPFLKRVQHLPRECPAKELCRGIVVMVHQPEVQHVFGTVVRLAGGLVVKAGRHRPRVRRV